MQRCACGGERSISTNPFDPDKIFVECMECGVIEEVGTLEEVVNDCLMAREISPIIHSMYEGISSAEKLEGM